MKHLKLKKKWKVLLIIIILMIPTIIFFTKDKKEVSNSLKDEPIVKKETPKVEEPKVEETPTEEVKEEVVIEEQPIVEAPVQSNVRVGLISTNQTDNITINNVYLTNNRTSFRLNEYLAIYINCTHGENLNGTIYITMHDQSYENYIYALEYNETNIMDGTLQFMINYEEQDVGYYDIHVMNNNTEVAYYVFQVVE